MPNNLSHNGIAICVAWPETLCKKAGSWYDVPLSWFNINKQNYYRVGHAAVILIEKNLGKCNYFDFGRYHAPYQTGRVRSAYTDHELELATHAKLAENGIILNLEEILQELSANKSSHGNGRLYASYCEINFDLAFDTAVKMQKNSPLPYGPFLPNGTNCSRFVNEIISSGVPRLFNKLLLKFPPTLSPTPMSNVRALGAYVVISGDSESSFIQNPEFTYEN